MSVTLDTSQLPIFWLKAEALANIAYMSVTLETSQLSMGWLKAEAPSNIHPILVTLETSHSFMLFTSSRVLQPLKASFKVVVPVKSKISLAVMLRLEHP